MLVAWAPKADASLLLRTVLGARLYKGHPEIPVPGSLFVVRVNLSSQAVIGFSPSEDSRQRSPP